MLTLLYDDLLIEIFSHLQKKDVDRLKLTCRKFRWIIDKVDRLIDSRFVHSSFLKNDRRMKRMILTFGSVLLLENAKYRFDLDHLTYMGFRLTERSLGRMISKDRLDYIMRYFFLLA